MLLQMKGCSFSWFVHSSVYGHLSFSHILTIVNNAAINKDVQVRVFLHLLLIEGYLQYCISFCHTSTWINHWYACFFHFQPPSFLSLHPTPLGCFRVPGEFPESYSKFPLAIYFTYVSIYVFMLLMNLFAG